MGGIKKDLTQLRRRENLTKAGGTARKRKVAGWKGQKKNKKTYATPSKSPAKFVPGQKKKNEGGEKEKRKK